MTRRRIVIAGLAGLVLVLAAASLILGRTSLPLADMLAHPEDPLWAVLVQLRLPRTLWPVPKAYGHVIAFTEEGRVVADLQDPTGAYPETTAITETRERLYVQSLHAHALGWLPASALTPGGAR